jgi:hypothetical protein
MAKNLILFAAFLTAVISIFSCNETTLIGSELLEDDAVNVNFVDTFSISAYTIPGQPLQSNVSIGTFTVGSLDDPIFGKSEAEMYFSLDRIASASLEGTTLDSVVLTIEYDTVSLYGEWQEAEFDIALHLGQDPLPSLSTDTFFSNERISYDPIPASEIYSKTINPFDSFLVYDPSQDSIIQVPAQFRFRLDESLSNTMFENLKTVTSDDDFDAFYPSIVIRAQANKSAALGFRAGNTARNNGVNALRFYYTVDSSESKREYELLFDQSMVSVTHDYEGSEVEEAFNDPVIGMEKLFVQGQGGVRTVVDIGSLRNINNSLLNKVELQVTVAHGDAFLTDIYPPLDFYSGLVAIDGNTMAIDDLIFAGSDPNIFDGILREVDENGNNLLKVNFNITNHVRNLLNREDFSSELIISSLAGLQSPARTVFYGPGHSTFPMKLNVAYTISQ